MVGYYSVGDTREHCKVGEEAACRAQYVPYARLGTIRPINKLPHLPVRSPDL